MTVSDMEKENLDRPKPFLEHLEELRWTVIWCLLALVLGMAVALPLAPWILKWLRAPLAGITDRPDQFLQSMEITGGFMIAFQTALWCGVLISAPVILLLIGRFVFPGLKRSERRAISLGLGSAVLLFILGAALCYFIVLPVALRVMLELHRWMGIQAWWTVTNYVSFVIQLLIAFGLAFELPMVLMVLGYLGVISSATLRSKRPYAIVILLALAMVLTPGPDVFSQVVMAAPLIILYELCVWSIRLFERKRRNAAKSGAASLDGGA
jgi:sec-independent protein translocase protein TatC